MKTFSFNKILFTILIFILTIPFALTACAKTNNEKPAEPQQPTEEVAEPDDNPNSPIKSGIYYFEKDELSFEDMFFLDDGTNAINHFKTQDINGVRLTLQNNEEKYHFNEFAKSKTKENGLVKCYEFNTENVVTVYTIDNGIYKKVSQFTYIYENTFFKGSDGDKVPFILYDDSDNTFSLGFKFIYKDENGKDVFPYVYIKVNMVYAGKSLDLLTKDSKTLSYKAETAKLLDAEGNTLDAEEYKEAINKKFNLELSENVMDGVTSLISTYKVYLSQNLNLVITSENGVDFKFALKSINNSAVDYAGNVYLIKTQFTSTENLSSVIIETTVQEGVTLQFEFEVK